MYITYYYVEIISYNISIMNRVIYFIKQFFFFKETLYFSLVILNTNHHGMFWIKTIEIE